MRLSDTTVAESFSSSSGLRIHLRPGTANHALTLYRHSSGALVFGAGTVQWTWGLDSNHDRGSARPSLAMQQATMNLLADMGAQPLTPAAGLCHGAAVDATRSAPTSTITSPSGGATVPANSTITITGTAVGHRRRCVGGVEVSVDGGVDLASGDRPRRTGPTVADRRRRAP